MAFYSRFHRKPVWGTCAGLILLAESANRTKEGGQDLIGGLDVRVNRNFFGRQTESFEAALELPFLKGGREAAESRPFPGVFIRAPVVEKILPSVEGEQKDEGAQNGMVIAPARKPVEQRPRKPVEIMATLSDKSKGLKAAGSAEEVENIVAVMQDNVFATSFHPELTQDVRIHKWWLEQIKDNLR